MTVRHPIPVPLSSTHGDTTDRLNVLDLFCCAGGSADGYDAAGFNVLGIDNDEKALSHYPYSYIKLDINLITPDMLSDYDLVTASPPCQTHSDLKSLTTKQYEDMLPFTRDLFVRSGKPYIIENVESYTNEHMNEPVLLCGTMFGLGATCKGGQYRELRRHRLFESNLSLKAPGVCQHTCQPGGVYGDGGGGPQTRGYKFYAQESREAMGMIRKIPRRYLSQSIPPAFTEWLGRQAMEQI